MRRALLSSIRPEAPSAESTNNAVTCHERQIPACAGGDIIAAYLAIGIRPIVIQTGLQLVGRIVRQVRAFGHGLASKDRHVKISAGAEGALGTRQVVGETCYRASLPPSVAAAGEAKSNLRADRFKVWRAIPRDIRGSGRASHPS